MHLASKFVETEIRALLKEYEISSYERSVLIAIAAKIIEAYEEYRYLIEGKVPATINLE